MSNAAVSNATVQCETATLLVMLVMCVYRDRIQIKGQINDRCHVVHVPATGAGDTRKKQPCVQYRGEACQRPDGNAARPRARDAMPSRISGGPAAGGSTVGGPAGGSVCACLQYIKKILTKTHQPATLHPQLFSPGVRYIHRTYHLLVSVRPAPRRTPELHPRSSSGTRSGAFS